MPVAALCIRHERLYISRLIAERFTNRGAIHYASFGLISDQFPGDEWRVVPSRHRRDPNDKQQNRKGFFLSLSLVASVRFDRIVGKRRRVREARAR